jgi:hypothetical protein
MSQVTVQIHHNGEWHDAALVDAESEQAGIASPSVVDCDKAAERSERPASSASAD